VRVALLTTCLVDGLYPAVGEAVERLLRRLGVEVEVPAGQTCCGQMHINSGHGDVAGPLVRRYAEVFGRFDAVVSPSGSCVGCVRHQHGTFAGEGPAAGIQTRIYELSEFLVDVLGVEDVGARYPHRVTYHPTCHSLRLLRVADRPSRLLRQVRDLELVELADAESCCGFGGTFAVKNSAVSSAMLTDKVGAITRTGATRCAAVDASCLMHIGGGLSREGSAVRPVHLAEILAST
jgi:L-lactate dehydrogenase complex protein LldE